MSKRKITPYNGQYVICNCCDCGRPIVKEKDIAYTFNDDYEACCIECS